MDLLGQLYVLCTILGWGFIIATFALGQFGHGHGIHADGAAHVAGHGAGGHAGHAGHIEGHAGHAGHIDSHAGHANHIDGHGGHHDAFEETRSTTANTVIKSRDNQLYFTLLGLLSPMSLSVFTGFFGSVGLIGWQYAHWLGYLTLIPAIIAGVIAINFVKHTTSLLVTKLAASSLTKMHEGVGRIAQVHTPIQNGRTGEVSYVIGHTRINASAKPAHEGEEFARGAKVMIVDTDGPLVFVEAARDIDLELT